MNRTLTLTLTTLTLATSACGSWVSDTHELYSITWTTFDDRLPVMVQDIGDHCTEPLQLRPDTEVDLFGSCREGDALSPLLLRPLQQTSMEAWAAVVGMDAEMSQREPVVMPRTLHVDGASDWLSFLEIEGHEVGCNADWSSRTDFQSLDLYVDEVYWVDIEESPGGDPRLRLHLSAPELQMVAMGTFDASLSTCGICTTILDDTYCFDGSPADWIGVDGVHDAHWEAGTINLRGVVDFVFTLHGDEILVHPEIVFEADDVVFELPDLSDPWDAGSVANLVGAGTVRDLTDLVTALVAPEVERVLLPEIAALVHASVPEDNEICWLDGPGLVVASDEPDEEVCSIQP